MAPHLQAILVIVLCLGFTYTNGLQDGSSVTASVISSRAMAPLKAVLLVATCELAGALLGGSAVASAVHSITDWPEIPQILPVLAAGLAAAISWNWLTKALKFPSSSTHALFGGLIGAILAASGTKYLIMGHFGLTNPTGVCKVLVSLFASPVAGFVAGFVVLQLTLFALRRASTRANRWLKALQTLTVGVLAFGHGANDPQKTMGIILIALHASGVYSGSEIPFWVRLSTGIAIAFGVASLAPGIVKKVGSIYRLRLLHGFVTEAAAGAVVLASSITGCPVSTSQVISSTVMGVGSSERIKDVHWLVARDILISWLLTMPSAGMLGAMLYFAVFQWLDGV